jgi:two-component system cell cycle sensor histidine kinase PleC
MEPHTTVAVVLYMNPVWHENAWPIAIIAIGAQFFFLILAHRLYATSLSSLAFRLEKESLISELEEAKANSDEARRRAEDANLAKSRFLATMSHELRTPLNAILGFSEVMTGELFGKHAVPAYKDYAKDIHASGEHLLMLINEILDLSRVEAGRYELREESVSLSEIVEDCLRALSLRAQKRGITISEAIEGRLPRIWGDERAMRQIALNLLNNAVKFTPYGGHITLKCGWTQTGGLFLSIRDTGPGIPPHEIPIVMSSFGRGALAQKNAEEGSGLGLPIVKGLVDLHGGTFTIESELRAGTEVTVTFPADRVVEAMPHFQPERRPPSPRRIIRRAVQVNHVAAELGLQHAGTQRRSKVVQLRQMPVGVLRFQRARHQVRLQIRRNLGADVRHADEQRQAAGVQAETHCATPAKTTWRSGRAPKA